MVSTPMSPSPHTKWIHLCCDDYLDFHIIDYVCVIGIDRNQRLWREIIPAIRGLKSSYFTQFTSILAMLGMFHCIIHTHFTHDIQIIYLVRLGCLEMMNNSPFYWLFTLLLVDIFCFSDTTFEGGHWHLHLQISPHLPLTIILGREVTFGGFILIIIAPPTAVTLMIGMLSDASRRGAKGNEHDFMGNIRG